MDVPAHLSHIGQQTASLTPSASSLKFEHEIMEKEQESDRARAAAGKIFAT